MSNMVLAVFDKSSFYCMRLAEYLRNNIKLTFDIQAFTRKEEFLKFSKDNRIPLLIISSECLKEMEKDMSPDMMKNVIILEEDPGYKDSGGIMGDGAVHISKFLPAMRIVETVLELCVERAEDFTDLGIRSGAEKCSVIGFYTPLSGSGQTSLAVLMGEQLSGEGKSILLSFESFSSLTKSFGQETPEDITDLMYYAECERDKFSLYLERIKITKSGLDYIAPARTSMQIRELTGEKIKNLIDLLWSVGGYEYVLLDLKDYPEGFFEILGLCDVVYTIGRNNSADQYRMGKYNKVLCENGYESVISRTVKCFFPDGRSGLTYRRYVRELISEGREVQSVGA